MLNRWWIRLQLVRHLSTSACNTYIHLIFCSKCLWDKLSFKCVLKMKGLLSHSFSIHTDHPWSVPGYVPCGEKNQHNNTLRMKSWSFLPDFLALLSIYHFNSDITHLLFDFCFNNLSKFSPCLDRVYLHFLPVKSLKFRNYRGKNICWHISSSTSQPPTCFTSSQFFFRFKKHTLKHTFFFFTICCVFRGISYNTAETTAANCTCLVLGIASR